MHLRQYLSAVLERLRGKGPAASLARGTFSVMVVSAGGMALSLAVSVLLARVVGSEGYGVYVYVLSWGNLLAFFAVFGLDNTALRFVSSYRARSDPSLLRGLQRRSYQFVLAISVLLAFIAFAALGLLDLSLDEGTRAAFRATCAWIPLTALLLLQSGILQGHQKVVLAQAPSLVIRPAAFALLLAAGLALFGVPDRAAEAVWLNFAASLVALGFATRWVLRTSREVGAGEPRYAEREWARVMLALMMTSLFQHLTSPQMKVFLVGTLGDTMEAGIYSVAYQLAMPSRMAVQAVMFMAAPLMGQLFELGQRQSLQRVLGLASAANLLISLPFLLLFALAGRLLLGLYGEAFTRGYPVLVLLAAADLAAGFGGGVAGWLMTMTGHESALLRISGGIAVLHVAAMVLLIPPLGALGAACTSLGAAVLLSTLTVFYVFRRMKLSVIPGFRKSESGASP